MKTVKKVIAACVNIIQSTYYATLYKKEIRKLAEIKSSGPLAVIIHLFYPEMWSTYDEMIIRLKKYTQLDVYVSIPLHKKQEADNISFGDSHVLYLPNKGRDVLPFLSILQAINNKGYQYLLKIHSKKSPQRAQGEVWHDDLLNKLAPNSHFIKTILNTLSHKNCGIIGPKDNYLPLSIYSVDNDADVGKAIRMIYDTPTALKVSGNKKNYGFFAGTMFWARLKSLDPICKVNFPIHYFALERGQLDGTFAHAMERVFSLVPEIERLDIYETTGKKIDRISYKSHVIQKEWDKRAANKTEWSNEAK